MTKKEQKVQISLVIIGILLIIGTYFYYPYTQKSKIIKKSPELEERNIQKNNNDNSKTTFFENVEHKGLYDLNNPFTVKSETAYILNEEPNLVYMDKMHVIMYLSGGRVVNIISNKGVYNKETYDCFFVDNVKATDGETNIFAENMDLLATENFMEVYNNVILDYPEGNLRADKIDYDFQTKFFKVSMFGNELVKMKVFE